MILEIGCQKIYQFYKYNTYVQRVLSRGKVALVGPQLEHFYKIGISDNEILYRLGSAYTYSDLSQLTELIWDLKPKRARALFDSGIIDFNDFS